MSLRPWAFSIAFSIGRPWQSQPGTKRASKPASCLDLTTMSFRMLFTAWPMCSTPLAYGGPSCSTNKRRAVARVAQLLVQALFVPLRDPARLALGQVAAHRERRVGQVQRGAVVGGGRGFGHGASACGGRLGVRRGALIVGAGWRGCAPAPGSVVEARLNSVARGLPMRGRAPAQRVECKHAKCHALAFYERLGAHRGVAQPLAAEPGGPAPTPARPADRASRRRADTAAAAELRRRDRPADVQQLAAVPGLGDLREGTIRPGIYLRWGRYALSTSGSFVTRHDDEVGARARCRLVAGVEARARCSSACAYERPVARPVTARIWPGSTNVRDTIRGRVSAGSAAGVRLALRRGHERRPCSAAGRHGWLDVGVSPRITSVPAGAASWRHRHATCPGRRPSA